MLILIISFLGISVVFIWGILRHSSSLFYPTLSRKNGSSGIALSFDDGPHPLYTPQVLDILDRYGIKATFFCVGDLAREHPQTVRMIHERGHLVGIHSSCHAWRLFSQTPPAALKDICAAGEVLSGITGYFPALYRPPVGIKTPAQMLAVWRLGLKYAAWSRRAVDGGRRILTAEIAARLARTARGGDVVLLHDGKLRMNGKTLTTQDHETAIRENLPRMIAGLKERGFGFARVDELFGIEGAIPAPKLEKRDYSKFGIRSIFKDLLAGAAGEHSQFGKLLCALWLGIFIVTSPFLGLHTATGFVLATKLRLNRVAVIAGTNITNPVTGPLIVFASVQAGWRMLHGSWLSFSLEELSSLSTAEIASQFFLSWALGFPLVGVLTGSIFCILLSATVWTVRRLKSPAGNI